VTDTNLSSLYTDLRRLTAGKAHATIADESRIDAETLKPWLRPGYVPTRKPPKENYERLVEYVGKLRESTKGDDVARETSNVADLSRKAAAWDAVVNMVKAVEGGDEPPPAGGYEPV
jgi:hypothetical protein